MIRIAILGTGSIAKAHIEAYLAFPERCKIVALVNRHPDKARALNERYALGADVHHSTQQIVFQCERARLNAPWDPMAFRALPSGFDQPDPETVRALDTQYQALDDLPYERFTEQEADDLMRAIENGSTDYLVQAEDGRNALEYVAAVYKSGFTEQTVSLPLQPDDPFYTAAGIRRNVRKFHEKPALSDEP